MFWILKSVNLDWNPNFWMILAYLRAANLESSSDFAPVTTILPEAKINAVVFGSRIRIMTAAKRYSSFRSDSYNTSIKQLCTFGLYSAFRAWRAIVFKSKRQSKLTVATMFLFDNRINNTIPKTEIVRWVYSSFIIDCCISPELLTVTSEWFLPQRKGSDLCSA